MTCSTLDRQLILFREAYNSVRVNVDDYELMYVFALSSNAKKQADRANILIEELGLNLVAIHAGKNSFFIVKSNETE